MLRRRRFMIEAAAPIALAALAAPGRARSAPALAAALPPAAASAFIRETGDRIVAVIGGAGSEAEKTRAMQAIVDQRVDVAGIARFSLGRFWRLASAAQRSEYDRLFRQVLVANVTAKIGAYKGVAFAIGRTTPREEGVMVATTVTRPGEAPAEVDWLVGEVGAAPRIVDVVAEGTSLRITQRSDYASFITHHNDDVGALIAALRKQVGQAG